MSINNEEVMTTYEAAKLLGIWHTVVRTHIVNGNLPARRFGKAYVLAKSDVLKFKADREERGLHVR